MFTFTDYKKALEYALLDVIMQGLQVETIKTEDTQEIASYILDRLDDIHSQSQAVEFLGELQERWHEYRPLYLMEKGKLERMGEIEELKEVADSLTHGTNHTGHDS